jgi:uncharacterized protein with NRDE domain
MCLALIALDVHPGYVVVLAANRDERHARPATPAAWWREGWVAGRDLTAGGTWLAVTRAGRYALVTNVREPGFKDTRAPSRGALVTRVVAETRSPAETVSSVIASGAAYNGFNLVAGDLLSSCWGSNRAPGVLMLTAGIHGLSNAALDTPWPKVERSKAAFAAWCASSPSTVDELFNVLSDRAIAADALLPATGVSVEWERRLSSPFIVGEDLGYGTRCSTIVLLGRDGNARFVERTFDSAGRPVGEVDLHFVLTDAGKSPRSALSGRNR